MRPDIDSDRYNLRQTNKTQHDKVRQKKRRKKKGRETQDKDKVRNRLPETDEFAERVRGRQRLSETT